ncbi:MAG TPA: sigma-70 family RNA polymerase sigma factor [Phycisphaerae bacterium]|nr:sigma-70 family RNA polymerase sigma factor [Phycisphaerae bacterium]
MPEAPKPNPQPADTELLRRHLEGDETAFAALVGRYRKELFNFLARFTGDAALAEDVFQETFLQVHLSAGAFDMDRRLKPWLFTIAANKARDALRGRSRRQAAPLDAQVSDDQRGSYADLVPSEIPSPEHFLANLETRQAVQNVVMEMPENLRIVLLLSYFHDISYQEISEMLNVPLGTVKSRLHAAVRTFAERWKTVAERDRHD